ncbi:MAG: DEAD/DEAH box helicase family protein, partial [Synergistaceae bacterium]|nr:DEAD/DEAH box helicase family protein [Synergistaceae bacterium]
MLRTILDEYRENLEYNRDKGDRFERLVRAFLKLAPQYASLFSDVWLWKDWPEREAFGYRLPDTGIDIVAKLREEEGYCAVQCKFQQSKVTVDDIASFIALSGKGGFTRRLLVATAPLNTNADDMLAGQTIPVSELSLEEMEEAPLDWSAFSLEKPEELKKTPSKQPRPHQTEALEAVLRGFETHERGKLVMACGTGKTYTSQLVAEKMVPVGGHALFLVPSIALLSQTLRAWTEASPRPLRCFAVCSDSKAGKDNEDIRIHELSYPATTDARKLGERLAIRDDERPTVLFSTYQSIQVVHEAQQYSGVEFDLVVCDEAHRTSGYTPKGEDHSNFVRIHDNGFIRARKRLYMTATPRIYAESSKRKAKEDETEVFSMDDESKFGPEFHRLRFGEAVERNLLSDYKVLVIAVDEEKIYEGLKYRIEDAGSELKLDDAVKIMGCWSGIGKNFPESDEVDISADPLPMRTAIAFAGSIKYSQLAAKEFARISGDLGKSAPHLPRLEAGHVDGTMNVLERNQKITWLKENADGSSPVCRILTNARCLSEGVDVPSLDAAIFLSPRDSVVDVVQSVGRVMRKSPGKKYGYVILPIGIG